MLNNDSLILRMDTQVSRSKEQVSANLEGDSIILNVRTGKYYSLNSVGSRFWELIETPVTIESIHNTFLDEYNADSELIQKDVYLLIHKLVNAGLVEVASGTE